MKAIAAALSTPFNKNGATADDLANDTEIPAPIIAKALDGMVALGAVARFPKEVPEIARGRTIWLYSLTGKKPGTDMVLP